MDCDVFIQFPVLSRVCDTQISLRPGLIQEAVDSDDTPRPGRQRRAYTLTDLGLAVARAEARRLRDTVAQARAEDLLAEGEGA